MGLDANNERLVNVANPKFDKDATNLRTLRDSLINISATTISATTINILSGIRLSEVNVQPQASIGLLWFSGGTLFIYSGSNNSDLVRLY